MNPVRRLPGPCPVCSLRPEDRKRLQELAEQLGVDPVTAILLALEALTEQLQTQKDQTP